MSDRTNADHITELREILDIYGDNSYTFRFEKAALQAAIAALQQAEPCPATPADLIGACPTVAYKRGWDDAAAKKQAEVTAGRPPPSWLVEQASRHLCVLEGVKPDATWGQGSDERQWERKRASVSAVLDFAIRVAPFIPQQATPALEGQALPTEVLVEADSWLDGSWIFGSHEDGFTDAVIYVGEHTDDDGKVGYGLLVRSEDYPEEGCVVLAELDLPNPARAKAQGAVAVCDGKEQDAFEAWAKGEGYDMSCHPLHWLFLNERTYAARDGWKAGLAYAATARRAGQRAAVPEGFLAHVRQVCLAANYLCQPKPQRSESDDTEHNGGLVLNELVAIAGEIEKLAAAPTDAAQERDDAAL